LNSLFLPIALSLKVYYTSEGNYFGGMKMRIILLAVFVTFIVVIGLFGLFQDDRPVVEIEQSGEMHIIEN